MPSQRPFAFASQYGSGGPDGGPWRSPPASHSWSPSLSVNGSSSAKRPGFVNPTQLAKPGANSASAASPAGVPASGGVVIRTPAPARNSACAAGAQARSAAQAAAAAMIRPPTKADRSAPPGELRQTSGPLCHTAAAPDWGGATRRRGGIFAGLVAALALAPSALADYPYTTGTPSADPSTYHLNAGETPDDITGGSSDWKYAATPESGAPVLITGNDRELNG